MPNWSPEAWNSLSVGGLVVLMGALLFVSLTRGWLVLGPYHREIVEGKDAALAELRKRGDVDAERAAIDAETIRSQAAVIAGRDTVEDINIKLLQAIRKATEDSR